MYMLFLFGRGEGVVGLALLWKGTGKEWEFSGTKFRDIMLARKDFSFRCEIGLPVDWNG